jgi:hypothetical protein
MVVEKHDGLWQNNQLYINVLRRYFGSGYPRFLLTGLKYTDRPKDRFGSLLPRQ